MGLMVEMAMGVRQSGSLDLILLVHKMRSGFNEGVGRANERQNMNHSTVDLITRLGMSSLDSG
jgi:hypothetical protein